MINWFFWGAPEKKGYLQFMEMLEGTMIANQWVFGGTQVLNNSIWSTAGASLRASLTRLNQTKAYAVLTFLLWG